MDQQTPPPLPSPFQGGFAALLSTADDEARTGLDWDAAIARLCKSRAPHVDNHVNYAAGQAVVNSIYKPLTDRWHAGERTPELHAAMMALPLPE